MILVQINVWKMDKMDFYLTKINVWLYEQLDAELCTPPRHAHMMMHDFYCEIFNDAAKNASASSDAEDAFNQTEFAVAKERKCPF